MRSRASDPVGDGTLSIPATQALQLEKVEPLFRDCISEWAHHLAVLCTAEKIPSGEASELRPRDRLVPYFGGPRRDGGSGRLGQQSTVTSTASLTCIYLERSI